MSPNTPWSVSTANVAEHSVVGPYRYGPYSISIRGKQNDHDALGHDETRLEEQ